jgi:cobalt-zinc-cadmium efflux system outer membrane protein
MRRTKIVGFGLGLFLALAPFSAGTPADAGGGGEVAIRETGGPLRLADALALALAESPELTAYSWQVRASEAHALHEALLPNPELDVELEDVAGRDGFRGTRSAQTTVRLSQLVELGGKRASRREVAAAMTGVAAREYEIKRVDVLADVAAKFVRVLASQQEVSLMESAADLAQDALAAAKRRVGSGKASALETRKASIALARARIDREHAEHELAVARKQLAATWGSAHPIFDRVEGDLFEREKLPSFESLSERMTRGPEIARQVSERKLREAEVALAETKRFPSVRLGAGVRRLEDPDTEVLVAEISIPFPVFDRGQGDTAEARAALQKTDAEHAAATVRLETVLFSLYQELQHAATALDDLEKLVVPEAQEVLRISREGFDQGRYSYVDLVDAQRTFLEVRTEAIETAVTFHTFLLDIERLTGEPHPTAASAR